MATADPTFIVTYSPNFTAAQRAAVEAAVDEWGSMIRTPVPIRVSMSISDLGSDILGGAGPNGWFEVPNGEPGVVYPQALANALAGYDVDPATPDITAIFDDDAAGTGGWYFGLDGNTPAGQYDFRSTVMHEIGHGLGFYATADSGASGCPVSKGCFGLSATTGDERPSIFDTHLHRGANGTRLLTNTGGRAWTSALAPNVSTALLDIFESQSIYFHGLFTDMAAGSTPARIYAPSFWRPASSMSHLDEVSYPAGSSEALMTPEMKRGEAMHAPGPITLGMMADIGWWLPSVVDAPNRSFVRASSHDFLNRLPDASVVTQFVEELGSHTTSRYGVVNWLARSPEWVSARVYDLYVATLRRSPDPAGWAYWTSLVASGQVSIAQLAAALYASPEAFHILANADTATWVGVLYDDLLGRAPEPAGLSYWVTLTRQHGRTTTAYALYQSAESRTRRVDDLYANLLGRAPDAAGRSYWASYLIDGDDVTLATYLAASDEYFLRSGTRGF